MAMTCQIPAATEYAKKLNIDAEADFAKHHRTSCPPKRLDGKILKQQVSLIYISSFKEVKCVLDVLVTQFREKRQPTLDIMAPLSGILQCPLHKPLPQNRK